LGTGSVASQASEHPPPPFFKQIKIEKTKKYTHNKIKIIFKKIFYPEYSTMIHKNILEWLKYKFISKCSGCTLRKKILEVLQVLKGVTVQ
jgi:hypothetical protein